MATPEKTLGEILAGNTNYANAFGGYYNYIWWENGFPKVRSEPKLITSWTSQGAHWDALKTGCWAWPYLEMLRLAYLERMLILPGTGGLVYDGYQVYHSYNGDVERWIQEEYNWIRDRIVAPHSTWKWLKNRGAGYTEGAIYLQQPCPAPFRRIYDHYKCFVDISQGTDFTGREVKNWTKETMESYLGEPLNPPRPGRPLTAKHVKQLYKLYNACHVVKYDKGNQSDFFGNVVFDCVLDNYTQRRGSGAANMNITGSTETDHSLAAAIAEAQAIYASGCSPYEVWNQWKWYHMRRSATLYIAHWGDKNSWSWEVDYTTIQARIKIVNPLSVNTNCAVSVYRTNHNLDGTNSYYKETDFAAGANAEQEATLGTLDRLEPPVAWDGTWTSHYEEADDQYYKQWGDTYEPVVVVDWGVEGGLEFQTIEQA